MTSSDGFSATLGGSFGKNIGLLNKDSFGFYSSVGFENKLIVLIEFLGFYSVSIGFSFS